MKLNIDIHSHSGYSGGVGKVNISDVVSGMDLKGIDIFGTGDCLHRDWLNSLKNEFSEKYQGIYISKYSKDRHFILQTELIFTLPYLKNKRKLFHMLVIFPDFYSVEKTINYIEKIGVKNNIGRPFVKFDSINDMKIFIEGVKNISDEIEFIPAHVMTPQGIFGSNNPVYFMEEIFGEGLKYINIVETGLSADPAMLSLIPELDNINFISNSDCHSPAINRIGREFTRIDIDNMSYSDILKSLKDPSKTFTYEFPPEEGKFYLTGHRKDKKGHINPAVFSPQTSPDKNVCPVCNKKLTVGVAQQLKDIVKYQKAENRYLDNPNSRNNYRKIVPLADVITNALGIKTFTKKAQRITRDLIEIYGSEISLWEEFNEKNHKNIDNNVLKSVKEICLGNFSFFPGYDGEYGRLEIGKIIDNTNIKLF